MFDRPIGLDISQLLNEIRASNPSDDLTSALYPLTACRRLVGAGPGEKGIK